MPIAPKLPPVPTGSPSEVAELVRVLQTALDDQTSALNRVLEGRISEWKSSDTTPPRGGLWTAGDRVRNTAPEPAGTAPNVYVVEGWLCIEEGTPGTWVELRVPMAYYGDPPAPTPAPTPSPAPTPAPTPIFDEQFTVDVGAFAVYRSTATIVDSDYMRVTNTEANYGTAWVDVEVEGGYDYIIDWAGRAGTAAGGPTLHIGDGVTYNYYANDAATSPVVVSVAGSGLQTVRITANSNSNVSGEYSDFDYITLTAETGAPTPSPAPSPTPPPGGTPPPTDITYDSTTALINEAYGDMNRASERTSNSEAKLGSYMNAIPYIQVGDYTDFTAACNAYPLGVPYNLPGEWNSIVPWFWIKPVAGHPDNENAYVQCGFCSVQVYNTNTSAWEYMFRGVGFHGKFSGGNSSGGAPEIPEELRGGLLVVDCNNNDAELWPKEYAANSAGQAFHVNPNKALLAYCGAIYIECAARLTKRDLNGPAISANAAINARLGYDAYYTGSTTQYSLRASTDWSWGRDARVTDGGCNANKDLSTDWQRYSVFSVAERGGPYLNGNPPPWSGTDGYSGTWAWDGCDPLSWWQANPPEIIEIAADWEPS